MPGDPPTLWSHFALPAQFGVADVVAFLSISLLLMFAAHYVDDFFSIESLKGRQWQQAHPLCSKPFTRSSAFA